MGKLKKQAAQPVKPSKKNQDPLVGLRFTYTRGDPPDYGRIEAKISPGVYLVRLSPDWCGIVMTASQMSKSDVVFHPREK
jgi:hypothetical protein